MTTPTDKELIALLHSLRPQDKATLDAFLDSCSTEDGNDRLHRIASQVVPSHGVRARHVMICCFPLICIALAFSMVSDMREGKSFLRSALSNTMPFSVCAMSFANALAQRRTRGGEESLLLLAARNDSRALPLLITEWQMHPSEKRSVWNARVEAEATRLLDENLSGTTSVEWRTMRKAVEQLIQPSQASLLRNRKDITPGQAYFTVAILRILTRAGGIENLELLKKVAALPTDANNLPNRTLVTEVAAVYQVEIISPLTAPMTATTPTATPRQTLHRF